MSTNSFEIQKILEFYIMAGVDETCGDVAFSQTIDTPKSAAEITKKSEVSCGNIHIALDAKKAVENANSICEDVTTIEELKKIIESFDGCSLKSTALSTVVGDGNPNAKIMFIGEAPGADEDRIGRAFVGRCGQLLDKMLSSIELTRDNCYICNVLPWRPPGNRTPADSEIAVCLPFLKKQIEIVEPDIIFALGAVAVNTLLDCADSISKLRGKWLEYKTAKGKVVDVMAGYHPAYLLRTPAQKAKAWSDFLRLKKKIEEK
jgi:DNA polymerase